MIVIFVGSEANGYREIYPADDQSISKLPATIIARALYFRTDVEDGDETSTEGYFVYSAASSASLLFYVSVLHKTQELSELAILAQAIAEKLSDDDQKQKNTYMFFSRFVEFFALFLATPRFTIGGLFLAKKPP